MQQAGLQHQSSGLCPIHHKPNNPVRLGKHGTVRTTHRTQGVSTVKLHCIAKTAKTCKPKHAKHAELRYASAATADHASAKQQGLTGTNFHSEQHEGSSCSPFRQPGGKTESYPSSSGLFSVGACTSSLFLTSPSKKDPLFFLSSFQGKLTLPALGAHSAEAGHFLESVSKHCSGLDPGFQPMTICCWMQLSGVSFRSKQWIHRQ